MNEFVAKGSRQVDLCMRMLFDEGIDFKVVPQLDDKERVYYIVRVTVDAQTYTRLANRYKKLIR